MSFEDYKKQLYTILFDPFAGPAAYLKFYNFLKNLSEESLPSYVRKIKIAFLSNFTINGLPEITKVRGLFHNLFLDIYSSPYDQCAQEILNSESNLYSFYPDIIYLFIDDKTLPNSILIDLIDQLILKSKAKIIVFNSEIINSYSGNNQIIAFDFQSWLSSTGHEKNWYTKYKELGDLRLLPEAFVDLSEKLLGYAVATSGITKKCVVVDLDNTLWQGVLGEDGFDKIIINKSLQEYLLDLFNKGIILAINSRNNQEEALQAIETHPEMILRKKHFAAWQINWGDKVSNMLELAKELNIGVDSFAFIDDDSFQQNLVIEALPEVAVIQAQNQNELCNFLKHYAGFCIFELTEEDIRRGQMYAEERERREFKTKAKTLDQFLKELNIKIEILKVNAATLTRSAQLTQKTNQFNLTTRRYSEEQLDSFLKNNGFAWTISASDRFGDYGIIGLAMIETFPGKWRVENFLLSCRILGRGVEFFLINYLFVEAKKNGIRTIVAEYCPTSKNAQTENFWDEAGFNLIEKDNKGMKLYNYNIQYV
jgi:FkbH-like protein